MVHGQYDVLLVTLSFVLSVLGSYTSLRLARRIPAAEGRAVTFWLAGAAFALGGCAIWSMHFIGMVAYKMDMTVRYDPTTTILSLLLAVAVTGVGLFIVGRGPKSLVRVIVGGLATGLGVAGMHYLGMGAMRMAADLVYDETLVAVSIVIAVVAASAALWLAFNLERTVQHWAAAVVMAIAVCGMHYTGMAAATMKPNDNVLAFDPTALTGEDLVFYVTLATATALAILLFTTLRERLYREPLVQG